MADRIVDGDSIDWGSKPDRGRTRYQHLIDGNARELDIRDYGHYKTAHFLTVLRKLCRDRGLEFRTKTIDEHHVAFQVTGKKKVE